MLTAPTEGCTEHRALASERVYLNVVRKKQKIRKQGGEGLLHDHSTDWEGLKRNEEWVLRGLSFTKPVQRTEEY